MVEQIPTRTLADVFKALADETRLQMLALLFERPELCVCHFEHALEISQSKASRHLRYLLNAGLLQDRREGVWMHYRLAGDMSPERRLILESVRRTLDRNVVAALRARLEGSLCAPGSTEMQPCCPPVAPDPTASAEDQAEPGQSIGTTS
ncbi:MAG: metalloregulator ArsR/SmtB family transcription factor [bacterium]